jgi:uncharacterized protein YndB with AHSA1/START domain
MRVVRTAHIEIPRPVEAVFDFAASCEGLPQFLHAKGPIPAVTRAVMEGGAALAPGSRRNVTMSDGSVMVEEITRLERPVRHAYRWLNRPKAPFSLLVRSGEADWTFSPTPLGTRIDWVYTFELTTPLVWPLASGVLLVFQSWMQSGLARLRSLVA